MSILCHGLKVRKPLLKHIDKIIRGALPQMNKIGISKKVHPKYSPTSH